MMDKSPEDLLSHARKCQDLAVSYATEANVALTKYAELVEAGAGVGSKVSLSANSGKSLIAWADWLAENGPSLRQKVWDGTGVNLTPKGLNQTREWRGIMAMWDDDALPADKVMRIPGDGTAAGRPPMIYFLWPQRFDVYGLFGVGPPHDPRPKKDLGQQYLDTVTRPTELTAEDETVIDGLLGVVQPPEQRPPTWDDLVAGAKPWPEQSFDFTAEDLTADGIVSTVSHGESQSNEDGDADG